MAISMTNNIANLLKRSIHLHLFQVSGVGVKVIADTLTNNNYQSLSLMSLQTLARGFCIYS